MKNNSTKSAEVITGELNLSGMNTLAFLQACEADVDAQDRKFTSLFGSGRGSLSSGKCFELEYCLLDDELYPSVLEYYTKRAIDPDVKFSRDVLKKRAQGISDATIFDHLYTTYKLDQGTWADVNFNNGSLFSTWMGIARAKANGTVPAPTLADQTDVINDSFRITVYTNMTNDGVWRKFQEAYKDFLKAKALAKLEPIKTRCLGLKKLILDKQDECGEADFTGSNPALMVQWRSANSKRVALEEKIEYLETH